MDTNSNISIMKKLASLEILHLDEYGYGPQGKHTRREWRKECLDNLLAGKDLFEAWQKGWLRPSDGGINEKADYVLTKRDEIRDRLSSMVHNIVPCSLDFAGIDFSKIRLGIERARVFFAPVNFENAKFVSFGFWGALFHQDAHFTDAVFNDDALFGLSVFHRNAYFQGVLFMREAIFDTAQLNGGADFRDSKFGKYSNFNETQFKGDAHFNGAIFDAYAHFGNAEFQGDAYFLDTKFEETAYFESAEFYGVAIFTRSTFCNDANFSKILFNYHADFQKIQFLGSCLFIKSTFQRRSNFENTLFNNIGHFEKVQFFTAVPAFRGCKIDSTRLEFSDDNYFPRYEYSEDAVKNISFLKRLSDEHGQSDQALNFNAMELRAKRLQTEPQPASWSFKSITWLYEKISDYGRSFIKPLTYYLLVLGVVFLLALGSASYSSPKDCNKENLRVLSDLWRDDTPCDISEAKPDDKIRLNGYRAAAEYTVYRAAGILDFSDNGKATDAVARRLFGQSYEPGWMRFIGLIKAVASIALLFLAALGLRNKYRIK
jgi:hypothetical protein